ncbi:uncharacterized protein LOC120251270 [Dioscorea cayenensis subsp. rotundata]|uniref:Uncharacterized protein LOC120251270 n=1 Tax=Dioscorea cayennensis subsp. rotundata TaxID=55577 RepID=A0AB40ALG0_DIOCR|nr:uncharacterized protein LOC120251270 [Dioscorea cayenensis subsp. rotundata]
MDSINFVQSCRLGRRPVSGIPKYVIGRQSLLQLSILAEEKCANRLRLVLPLLIGREQAGFVSDRCSFDNIIAVQEIVHSLETDTNNPPRMLIKLDIEKAYDTVNWSAILAVLTRMNFPPLWISWISTCLRSSSFSVLVHGNPSPWFSSSRGVRQGDPISSYLFILVSQILSNLLNLGLSNSKIPGFNPSLAHNFNHLMFTDDLILITRASRSTARNIILCLNLYSSISGQFPNHSKSQIFFPTWCNKHISKRISSILNITSASFPFIYLGILISPNRIAASAFNNMVDRIRRTCNSWSRFHLSPAAKTILINTSLLAVPIYTLSVYPIPDSILNEISRAVRKFFWSRDSNGKGIHNVSWSTINDGKPEGGIGIRNLSLAKYSLKAKHVFKLLNNDSAIWVDIMRLKYGHSNFWMNSAPARCSWFYRSLFNVANRIKPFCRIGSVNPINTSFAWDPWCFDLPIARKPTFINMNVDLDNLSVSNFITGNGWDIAHLCSIFGSNFNMQVLLSNSIDYDSGNQWIWSPSSKQTTISSSVYHHLNHNFSLTDVWMGWRLLWNLSIAPRVKHFLWTLFHGRLSTYNFLYLRKLRPNSSCPLCTLFPETIDHLFSSCSKAQLIWSYLSLRLGMSIHFPNGFAFGSWLTDGFYSNHTVSVIAATAWFLWKSRCDIIFRNANLNPPTLVCKAISHVQDHFECRKNLLGSRLILNNFTLDDELFLFVYASTNLCSMVSFVGFFVSNAQFIVSLAGCFSQVLDDNTPVSLLALRVALQVMLDSRLPVKNIFVDDSAPIAVISNPDPVITWRFRPLIDLIKSLLNFLGSPVIHIIPDSWMMPAASLATLGFNDPALNLFLFGRDLPHWLMRCFHDSGFIF